MADPEDEFLFGGDGIKRSAGGQGNLHRRVARDIGCAIAQRPSGFEPQVRVLPVEVSAAANR